MLADPDVFEGGYVPQRLQHRDRAVNALARAFDPALSLKRPKDVLLAGPHGVGKTVLVRHTFQERFQERAPHATWVYVETMGLTATGIVRAALRALGGDPAHNTPREDLALALRERIDRSTVIVLDEADDLPETAVRRLWDCPLVGVVAIVHDADEWLSRVDDDLRRRFQSRVLRLERYNTADLADILQPRVREGLDTTVERAYLERIADRAAGDARQAIQTLRAAAEIAAERGVDVEAVAVANAHERAMQVIRQANLDSLPFHHHVLYELIRRGEQVGPGVLHEAYERAAPDIYAGREHTPIGKRSRRNKLEKLAAYALIDPADSRHDTYTVCDPSVSSDVVALTCVSDLPEM